MEDRHPGDGFVGSLIASIDSSANRHNVQFRCLFSSPWEPDVNAAPPHGNIVFYDVNGNEVTSGTNLTSPFAYAVATTGADPGADKAIMNFYDPNHGAPPGAWGGTPETGTTTFDPASGLPTGTPANVAADAPTHPVAATGTANIETWLGSNTPDPTVGYANTIQVRLTDSGPRGAGNPAGTYWETDIGYNTTASAITVDGTTVPANGWAQLFPLVTKTTTALTSTLTSPQPGGTNIPLKATVSPAEAGTVQLFDGATALGSPVAVSGGVANFTDSRPPAIGSHSYTAVFSPLLGETGANTTSAAIIGGSTSSALSFTINGTTVTSSANPVAKNAQVTFTATVTPTPTGGTVTFLDGGSPLAACTSETLTSGVATCKQTFATAGLQVITASYSGTTGFPPSTSPPFDETVTTSAGGLVPITPSRILDTRHGTGGTTGPVAPGHTVGLTVLGVGGVPTVGVGAVVLNVTVTAPTAPGFITVYPAGATQPNTASLNFTAGETVANAVVAPVGAGGVVDFFNDAGGGSVQIVADVSGWFASAPSGPAVGGLGTLTPARILDTRNGTGGTTGPVAPGQTVALSVLGAGGLPPSGIGAVVLNVTATAPTAPGFLTIYPAGATQPNTANLNFVAGQTVPNLVIAPVGAGGVVDIFNDAHGGSVQIVADVSGWFAAAPSGPAAGGLGTLTPARILDTRNGTGGTTGPVAPGQTVHLSVLSAGGVPSSGVGAVVLNVTATAPTAPGFLTVYPAGATQPNTASLNFVAGQTVPNLVIAPVGAGGVVNIFNDAGGGSVQIVADVSGWLGTP